MNRITIGLLAVVLAVTLPRGAAACSCPIEPLEELVPGLAILFEGEVDGAPSRIAWNPPDGSARDLYRFKVRRVWKGDVGPSFSVAYPPPDGAACGTALKAGDVLMIGAHPMRGKPAVGNSCTIMNLNQPSLDVAGELGAPRVDYRQR